MKGLNGPKAFADYIHCLSILENNTAQLYHALSDWTVSPLAKSLLLNIALDSAKHSTLLKGISDSLTTSKTNLKECAKNLGEVWRLVDALSEELTKKRNSSKLDFSQLADKLTNLESELGEEYHIFVQMKNLEALSKEINQLYNVEIGTIRKIINSIIKDEDHHRELLSTIRRLLEQGKSRNNDNTPIVNFQSPDSWTQSSKIAAYEEP